MKETITTFPFFHEYNDFSLYSGAVATWHTQIKKELKARAFQLLQFRAGGRYTNFEAGMLYQICLELGMKDSREGKIGEQEQYWEQLVCSCITELEARQTLEKLLKGEKALTRKEKQALRVGGNKTK